ncbi:alpha/beta hydrolase [Singulisphaera acidiphila]|uniref:Esterase/lipase n=1 Tax=Singulisphaera acidiphila (strain ATCC BAA-1392 / DSM 18658 / VKM B-2454 / MOB10) TaxID=886293 RepID=L0DKG4_SINAD|nr:alpha/beta hydrolase [Singulisphaera acidiphila]AGA29752.1 esterase/lipase [Singulisphaera acidiphila DSM 18658]
MPLDPQAKEFLESLRKSRMPSLERLPLPLARAAFATTIPLAGPREEVASVEDRPIPGNLTVRIYTPADKRSGPRPALVYFHGGGWVVGSLDTVDAPCRQLANAAACTVISVAYRLAPEHKFPIPVEDCFLATRYVAEHAADFQIDPAKIAVGGDSAGGNLAAAVTMLARDRGGPSLAFQLLIYPATDAALDTPSHREFAKGFMLTRSEIQWFMRQYLVRPEEGEHPLVSILRAKSVRGLPPACVITAEFDPLRDEGEAYAARLRAASVPVESRRFDGMIHGFFQMAGIMDQGKTAIQYAAAALKAAWA